MELFQFEGARLDAPGREAAPEGKVSGSARPDEGEPPRPANGAAMGARALISVVTSRSEIRSRHRLGSGLRALNRGNPHAWAGASARAAARLPNTGDPAKRALMSPFSIKLTVARITGPVA